MSQNFAMESSLQGLLQLKHALEKQNDHNPRALSLQVRLLSGTLNPHVAYNGMHPCFPTTSGSGGPVFWITRLARYGPKA